MSSLNQVNIIGRLGRDPEVRYSPSGDAICNISIATSETWKDKNSGEKKEATEWHRVVMYGKLAEIAGEYLKQGSLVYIQGKLKTRKWQDKDTGADRYSTDIQASEMKMLGSKSDGGGSNGGQRQQQQAPAQKQRQQAPAQNQADLDDDIPF